MGIAPDVLAAISSRVLSEIRAMSADEFHKVLVHRDYHDFGKDDFTTAFIVDVLHNTGLTKNDVQIDIITVDRDLTHQVHYHKDAHAYVVILGPNEHVAAPVTAEAYLDGRWFPVSSGQVLSISPGIHHGFRVKNNAGDVLRFLSVQSPPIVRESEDDYHNVLPARP